MTAVDLLWTGGWDSSFRLLDLAIRQGRAVQPIYLRIRQRNTPNELAAMEAIKAQVETRFGSAVRGLILDTQMFDASEKALERPPEIRASFQRLRARWLIGTQYVSIASFARSAGLTALEMSVHRDDRLYTILRNDVVLDGDAHVLRPDPGNPDLEIFRPFRFPLLMSTKRDMGRAAEAAGFADLMELTVFCHHPDSQGRPCGYCNPCTYAIREGMGRRIPWSNYLRNMPLRHARQARRAIRLRSRLRVALGRA